MSVSAPADVPVDSPDDADPRPPLIRDRSYWGFLVTQFLGAFNDNFYKQFVLLMCLDYKLAHNLEDDPYQSTAGVVFALPFILFSLYTGAVADRYSKRSIVVLCKVGEIAVMAAALAVFLAFDLGSQGLLVASIVVIGLMSLQSTLFSPAKYGILPDLFRESDLPRANGGVQMSTFLAIVLGMALAGIVKQQAGDRLWVAGAVAIAIAAMGTATSLLIRRTPVALPGEPFRLASFIGDPAVWRSTFTRPELRRAVLTYVLFWLAGSAALPAVNALGREQLARGDIATSMLAMMLSLGMGIGCFVAGYLGRDRNRPDLIVKGSLGLPVAGLLVGAAALVGGQAGYVGCLLGIAAFGALAGLTAVPLLVVVQSAPKPEERGRTLGVNNFCTWMGVLIGQVVYYVLSKVCVDAAGDSLIGWGFAAIGAIMLPAVVAYRDKR